MSSKVHSQGNVPFSWENKPGIRKAATDVSDDDDDQPKLPPPPFPVPPPSQKTRVSSQDLQIPLPPCPFQVPPRHPSRSGSKKGKVDDPFLIALKEVTKSNKLKGASNDQGGLGINGLMKNVSIFSCKQSSCSVAESSMVRVSQLSNYHQRSTSKTSHKHRQVSSDY